MINVLQRLRRLDYRHYISIAITVVFIGCGYLFINSIPRLLESIRDLGFSCAYYFCGLFMSVNPITATVLEFPMWQLMDPIFEPIQFMPIAWEEFQVKWSEYWTLFVSKKNVEAFFYSFGDLAYWLSKILLVLLPVIVLLVVKLRKYTQVENNAYNVDSRQLQTYKRIMFSTYYPVRDWLREFIAFLREHSIYVRIWAWTWALYFNIISVVIEFIAFYLYLIVSFGFKDIYGQALKLLHDFSPMLRFVPIYIWIGLALIGYEYTCRNMAYSGLYHRERCNRGFINERGVVTIVYGAMGTGKTKLVTDMSLSWEVQMRDMAYEIMLETDMHFPVFPWVHIRNEVKRAVEAHKIVDVPSCRRWVANWERSYINYQIIQTDKQMLKAWRRHVQKNPPRYPNLIFDYDTEHYPTEFNDALKITNIWQAIEDYACAYLIYQFETSLIISNYSIRTDNVMECIGNLPVWDNDFFKRDPRFIDSISRHSHILDFDMVRIGVRMLKDNPRRNAFGFGCYVISEIDKERKNAPEMQGIKSDSKECNQKNDLFNSCLKMSRHAVVIANRVFLKIFCDLQRPEDWSAGGREVGEIVYIRENGEMCPTLPFFSWFWLIEKIVTGIKVRFNDFYTRYIFGRGDNTLLLHVVKVIVSAMENYCERMNNLFGSQTLKLEVESGRMDGDIKNRKYYIMPKKAHSRRYATNCLSAIFQSGEVNTVSIADLREYADDMANNDELDYQNSHFHTERRRALERFVA